MIEGTLGHAAQIIQLALTPIFLLTAVASLLNVFSARLARIADRADKLLADGAKPHPELRNLRIRSQLLDIAVVLAAFAGALTCAAAATLFVGVLRAIAAGTALFSLFGAALVCSILSLLAFTIEVLMSGRSIRDRSDKR